MERICGRIPSELITIEEQFVYSNDGSRLIIQANEKGWAILYEDGSCEFKDSFTNDSDNFDEAYRIATLKHGSIKRILGYITESGFVSIVNRKKHSIQRERSRIW